MLTIYKASAGSGKTYRLVGEYLKQIFQNEYNYKNILAVTFTNKATAEMKERVVSQLYKISENPENSSYTTLIVKETSLKHDELKVRAKEALRNILHDYNRFSISTIDKFTQRVIKSFNRELGLTPGYILELDNEMLLFEATDRLILKAGTDKELLNWLTQLGEERIRDNKSFNIRDEIINLGKELFKEKYQDFFIEKNQELYNRSHLKEYRNELRNIIRSFETILKEKGIKGLQIIKENNLSIEDFSYGSGGVAGAFLKTSRIDFNYGKRVRDASEDAGSWIKKSHGRKNEVLTLVENQLLPLLIEILEYYDSNRTHYITAQKIAANLFTLGVLNDLQKEIDSLRHEKGILPLSDSNLLLKKIINGSDSPFIYEKTGNTYNYFMLDEFQDTSGMQWSNFKPLIDNTLAEGKRNLIVGDVKQSIYRWRNSDWNILANLIEKQFDSQQFTIKNLDANWRSDSRIIEFNNIIFPELVNQITSKFKEEEGEESSASSQLFSSIYNDVEQFQGIKGLKNSGFTKVAFIENSEESSFKEQSLKTLLEQVKELQDSDYTGKDIAILVRRNSEGSDIIRFFLSAAELPENSSYNFEIISNESLFLNSSKSVNFVAQLINHLINPDDKITKANILNEYKVYIQPELARKGKDIVYKTVEKEGQVAFNFANREHEKLAQLDKSYEEEFETIFKPIIEILQTNILNASIDEAITFICNTFNLFDLKEDLPYLQGLIDQSAQIKSTISNDLSNFLKWWNEKGYKLSVNVNDDTDAIRLMTIHKSKGLEFKAVLIPFFDWSIGWNNTPTLWCEPKSEPFNKLPLVPVKAVNEMKKTIFRGEYFEELLNTYVDNLNLVYVAFTRAISVLYINAPFDENSSKPGKVNHFLFNSLSMLAEKQNWQGDYDESNKTFAIGHLQKNERKSKESKKEIILNKYSFFEFNSRLKLRTDSDNFFSESGLTDKNLGKLLHEILSGIEIATDIKNACQKALKLQKINTDEYKTLVRWLQELLDSAQARDWFSGIYKVFTERELLSKEAIKRPDRIMIKGNKAIIVDYKLGHAMPEIYNRQVKNYSQELKKTGIDEVEGYLWYLIPNKIEKICAI
ncbi:MAG: UvrD-helicase domain-containing protein [Mariniphaga sp.]|nr:UvrD-helicase domain-containing protein [Mariniphaga sp.]